ncbi:MAG: hypothetical protein OXU50_07295 [Gammaproteobacteria bacterium]|nr:hypothetical protein [Gammaproteobacteria bacterium]
MISVVVPNWNRAWNLTHCILPVLEQCACVDEIIITHGRRDTVFDYDSARCRIVHRRDDGDVNRRYGLARRFVAVAAARNDTVLSLDDDIIVPESSLLALHEHYLRDPDIIHSLYGRDPDRELGYSNRVRTGAVTYALTGAALLPKRLADAFFEHAPLVEALVRSRSEPLWNGEDLFMSLVAIQRNRRLNRAYPLPRIELRTDGDGAPAAVSGGAAHLAWRSLLSQCAIRALAVGGLVRVSRADPPPPRLASSLARLARRLAGARA